MIVGELKALLTYNPDTGHFYWLVRRGCRAAGQRAGWKKDTGYIVIGVDGLGHIRAHNLAWFYMTGEWPPPGMQIDHKNRVRDDNRWTNLRLASPGQNSANASRRSDNTTGHPGVHYFWRTGRYQAYVQRNRKMIHLGYFKTIEAAIAARLQAESEHFGAFAPNVSPQG